MRYRWLTQGSVRRPGRGRVLERERPRARRGHGREADDQGLVLERLVPLHRATS